MRHYRKHHRHVKRREIDLNAELSRMLKKLAALQAVVPGPDPEPFALEIPIGENHVGYSELPTVIQGVKPYEGLFG